MARRCISIYDLDFHPLSAIWMRRCAFPPFKHHAEHRAASFHRKPLPAAPPPASRNAGVMQREPIVTGGFLDFRSLKLPLKKNMCLLAPAGHCLASHPDVSSPTLNRHPTELFEELRRIVDDKHQWRQVVTDAATLRIKFVATTPFLRFKDDVDIEVVPIAAMQTSIAIYSRSRVGYFDFGKNRKRAEQIVSSLTSNRLY